MAQFSVGVNNDEKARTGIINSAGSRLMALGKCKLHLTLMQDQETSVAYAKEVKIEAVNSILELKFSKPNDGIRNVQIIVDGVPQKVPQNTVIYSTQGIFLPRLVFLQRVPDETRYEWRANPWRTAPFNILRTIIHGNAASSTVERIAGRLTLTSPERLVTQMKTIPGPPSWREFVNDDGRASFYAAEISRSLLIASCGEVIEKLDSIVSTFFQGVRYLKPLRATAERYYRQVDLSVSEVDSDGRNFAMFLSSMMATPDLVSFQAFVRQYLGIWINVAKEGEQVSVVAKTESESNEFNIADMGFGISQVLPLAAQLWLSLTPRLAQNPSTVVVLEQPELHLHPDLQSRLADLFSAFTESTHGPKGTGQRLIVETHSEALVERFGQLIERGKIRPADVQVLLFEPSGEPNTTHIRVAAFDSEGVLKNWPYGFFDPEAR